MWEDSGVEDRRDGATECGRRHRELTTANEYGRDSAEEAGRRDLFCSEAQRDAPRGNA
jgi:hypothetical protein